MTWLRASHVVAVSIGLLFPAPCIAQTPPATSRNQLLVKAQTGDSDAQYQLGLLYERGSTDTPKDYSKALEWFRRSAEKGNPKAENALRIAYGNGYGVVEDDRAAFNWFYKAALKGYPAAQHNLAADYRRGRGTPKNENFGATMLCEQARATHAMESDDGGLGLDGARLIVVRTPRTL